MRTIVVFHPTDEEKAGHTTIYEGCYPSFTISEDELVMCDYDDVVVSPVYNLKAIKSVTWDEQE